MYKKLDPKDKTLIDAATKSIQRNYQDPTHTVGAALLCDSGKTYTGINVAAVACGSCAEQITVGTALSSGERTFRTIVAVDNEGKVISPCGNCRQLLFDYAPGIEVIIPHENRVVKTNITNLLPNPYIRVE